MLQQRASRPKRLEYLTRHTGPGLGAWKRHLERRVMAVNGWPAGRMESASLRYQARQIGGSDKRDEKAL